MRRLVLVAFLAIACGAIPVQAQNLALAYHTGDTYRYTLHTSSVLTFGGPTDLTALETITVQSVDSSGTVSLSIALSHATIKSSDNSFANSVNGKPIPAVDINIAADGRILANGLLVSSTSGVGGSFTPGVVPDKPVKPGDTWSKDFDQVNPFGTGSSHIATHSKYVRNESLQGINAAVVETTSNETFDLTIDVSKIPGAVIPDGAVGHPDNRQGYGDRD